jgi:hypothetical protein
VTNENLKPGNAGSSQTERCRPEPNPVKKLNLLGNIQGASLNDPGISNASNEMNECLIFGILLNF